jgi:hypothetical protein
MLVAGSGVFDWLLEAVFHYGFNGSVLIFQVILYNYAHLCILW